MKKAVKKTVLRSVKQALGPSPGAAIVSFWQGVVEVTLRTTNTILLLGTFVAAAVTLNKLLCLQGERWSGGRGTEISTGWMLTVTIIALGSEFLGILIRFLNCGIVNMKIKGVLTLNIAVNTVLCLGIMAGVIVLAKQTADLKDDGEEEKMREVMITMISMTTLGAVAGVSLVLTILWLVLFVLKGWNVRVILYTAKTYT